jgi:hypothetical protein
MIVSDDSRRPEQRGFGNAPGWTSLHSWIFLAIVALALLVIGLQNRYHYLNPQGLGKAYRIDKLFGGIQEFEPGRGWISAQLQSMAPGQGLSMMEPPAEGSQAVPMNMPGAMAPRIEAGPPTVSAIRPTPKEETVARREPSVAAKAAQEPSVEEKYKIFKKAFPEFGQDEFQLANDDLYPDWKKSEAPNGTWPQFLALYKDFIQWWTDAGSPPEPGYKLWKDFRTGKSKK